jgi:hypothetical protein
VRTKTDCCILQCLHQFSVFFSSCHSFTLHIVRLVCREHIPSVYYCTVLRHFVGTCVAPCVLTPDAAAPGVPRHCVPCWGSVLSEVQPTRQTHRCSAYRLASVCDHDSRRTVRALHPAGVWYRQALGHSYASAVPLLGSWDFDRRGHGVDSTCQLVHIHS